MQRIDTSLPLQPAAAEAMAKLLPAGMKPPELFIAVARNAGLFAWMVDTGLIGPTGLLDRRALPKALREAVILRTCVATRNEYEFNLHVQTISARMGLSEAQIADVRRESPDPASWSAAELAALRLVDALVKLDVSDELWTQSREVFDEATLIELTQLTGMYVGVAMQVALLQPRFDSYR